MIVALILSYEITLNFCKILWSFPQIHTQQAWANFAFNELKFSNLAQAVLAIHQKSRSRSGNGNERFSAETGL